MHLGELVVGYVSFQIQYLWHEDAQDSESAVAPSDPKRAVKESSLAIAHIETGTGSFVGIVDVDIGPRDQPVIGPNQWIMNGHEPARQHIMGEESALQFFRRRTPNETARMTVITESTGPRC